MKTYRDWARDTRGITEPEFVVPRLAPTPPFTRRHNISTSSCVPMPLDDQFCVDVPADGRGD